MKKEEKKKPATKNPTSALIKSRNEESKVQNDTDRSLLNNDNVDMDDLENLSDDPALPKQQVTRETAKYDLDV